MPDKSEQLHRIGDFWLSKRDNSEAWCLTWFDAATEQTKRTSLRTRCLEEAKAKLAQHVTIHGTRAGEQPKQALMADVCTRYFAHHGRATIGAKQQHRSLLCALERVTEGMTVGEFNLVEQKAWRQRMKAAGYADGTVKRCLNAVKAAVNFAFNNGELDRPIPFVSVPDGEPRKRRMSVAEMARLWDAAEPEHLRTFLLVLLATAARPGAVLDLTRERCDLSDGLIHLYDPARARTKKHRPIVAMPDFLRPVIEAAPPGSLVRFRGKAVTKISKSFRDARDAAGLDAAVSPYTFRHTLATMLRKRGVSMDEIAGQLGHRSSDNPMTEEYAAYDPNYLSLARKAIDEVAREIGRAATRPFPIPKTALRASSVLVEAD